MSQMEPSSIAERQYYIALMKIMTNQRSFGVPYFQTNMTGHLMVHWGLDMNLVLHLLIGKAGGCTIQMIKVMIYMFIYIYIYIRHHKAGFRYWMPMDVNGFNCFV